MPIEQRVNIILSNTEHTLNGNSEWNRSTVMEMKFHMNNLSAQRERINIL